MGSRIKNPQINDMMNKLIISNLRARFVLRDRGQDGPNGPSINTGRSRDRHTVVSATNIDTSQMVGI